MYSLHRLPRLVLVAVEVVDHDDNNSGDQTGCGGLIGMQSNGCDSCIGVKYGVRLMLTLVER
jgi:hypothetical protein